MLENLYQRLRTLVGATNSSIQPVAGYPSSVVDSDACEFGFEMYYHLAYAYHLHCQGKLTKTISCKDTKCFYWFSPNHVERYKKRKWVARYPSVDQEPHQSPDFQRWTPPDYQSQYEGKVDFGFDKPLLLVFNKYNGEWLGPPVNFLSKEILQDLADSTRDLFQMVYCRPTSRIVADDSEVFDLAEKDNLAQQGVVMIEDIHNRHGDLTFNELQIHLLSQAKCRIAVQGGATYLNALLPGDLYVLHRRGEEINARTYEHLRRMPVSRLTVFDDETKLARSLYSRHLRVTENRGVAGEDDQAAA